MNNKRYDFLGRIGFLGFTLLFLIAIFPGPAASAETRLETEGIDGGKAVLEFTAEPLRTMTPTPFRLVLIDGAGKPVTGAEVRCELTMPAMPMPENRPVVHEEDGSYRGEAIFTMAGAWQAAFRVAMPAGRTEALAFDIDRVLLK